jgi:ABC-type sugar transport system substrate-binding protein
MLEQFNCGTIDDNDQLAIGIGLTPKAFDGVLSGGQAATGNHDAGHQGWGRNRATYRQGHLLGDLAAHI